MRGLWAQAAARRRSCSSSSQGEPQLGRRHVAVLAHVGTEGERTVGDLARELGLSLPAASKLTTELEDAQPRPAPRGPGRPAPHRGRPERAHRGAGARLARPRATCRSSRRWRGSQPTEREGFLKGLARARRRADGRIRPVVLSDRTIARLIADGRIGIDPYDDVAAAAVERRRARRPLLPRLPQRALPVHRRQAAAGGADRGGRDRRRAAVHPAPGRVRARLDARARDAARRPRRPPRGEELASAGSAC